MAFAVERETNADQFWITAKAALPQTVADDHNLLVTVAVFFRQEVAPQQRRDAERREQIGRGQRADQALRLAAPREIESGLPIHRDLRKTVRPVAVIHELRRRDIQPLQTVPRQM